MRSRINPNPANIVQDTSGHAFEFSVYQGKYPHLQLKPNRIFHTPGEAAIARQDSGLTSAYP